MPRIFAIGLLGVGLGLVLAPQAAAYSGNYTPGTGINGTVHDLAVLRHPGTFNPWTRHYSHFAVPRVARAARRLIAVSENYPELKATQAFRDLQSQLEGSENRIAVERGRFNETAQAYNTARLQFPANIVANIAGFGEKAYFKAQAGSEQVPKVQFQSGVPRRLVPLPSGA